MNIDNIRVLEFPAQDFDRQELANMSNDELLKVWEDHSVASYTIDEFTAMLNDSDSISESLFFKVDVSKKEPETCIGHPWDVTIEDFRDIENYDVSNLTAEQIHDMIEVATEAIGDSDTISEYYWMYIRETAESFGLLKNLEALCSDHFADFYRAGVNVKEYFPECQEEKDPDFLGIAVPDHYYCGKWLEKAGYYTEEHSTPFVTDDGDRYNEFDVVYVYKAKKEEEK